MHVRSIQHVKETDDDVEFATDMEEPVCRDEEHNHQQERHPHGITVVYLGFLRIVAKETTVDWIIVLNSFYCPFALSLPQEVTTHDVLM